MACSQSHAFTQPGPVASGVISKNIGRKCWFDSTALGVTFGSQLDESKPTFAGTLNFECETDPMNLDTMVLKFDGDPPSVHEIGEHEGTVSLGSVASAKLAISKVFPSMHWSTSDLGTFESDGNCFEFNLGCDDPVERIFASAHGSENVRATLLAVAVCNGWTLVDMSTGAYVSNETRASSRISALLDSKALTNEVLAAAIGAELRVCVDLIERELIAIVHHYKESASQQGDTPSRSRQESTLRACIKAVSMLLPLFPAGKASKWEKLLGKLKNFLMLFEPYVLALPASHGLHSAIGFAVKDNCSGMKIKVAWPPMAPVVFATEMEELLASLKKAREALIDG